MRPIIILDTLIPVMPAVQEYSLLANLGFRSELKISIKNCFGINKWSSQYYMVEIILNETMKVVPNLRGFHGTNFVDIGCVIEKS